VPLIPKILPEQVEAEKLREIQSTRVHMENGHYLYWSTLLFKEDPVRECCVYR